MLTGGLAKEVRLDKLEHSGKGRGGALPDGNASLLEATPPFFIRSDAPVFLLWVVLGAAGNYAK